MLGDYVPFFKHGYSLSEKYRDALRSAKAELENRSNINISEAYDQLRMWKHDSISRLNVIRNLVNDGNTDELTRFLDSIAENLGSFTSIINTEHPIVDAIISNEIAIAKRHGIAMKPVLILPALLPIGDIEMCSIISNLIDNAIEAVDRLQGRNKNIDFSIGVKAKSMIIQVTNPSDGVYETDDDNELITIKQDKLMHGLGLRRVKDLVSKANGVVCITPETTKFSVLIMIPLKGVKTEKC